LECIEKIVWPSTLTKSDPLNASVARYRTSVRNITTATAAAAVATTITWVWFFGFLDDSGQIYSNGFAWLSVVRTQNVLETATSLLIKYGATAVNAAIGGIVVVIESSRQARVRGHIGEVTAQRDRLVRCRHRRVGNGHAYRFSSKRW